MSALTKKAVTDVTRRKLRTALTVVGIAVSILGLTAIGVTSSQLNASIDYTNSVSAEPDIVFSTMPASPLLAQTLAGQPNVKAAQAETETVGRWAIPTGHFTLAITGLPDPTNVTIGKFKVVEGSLPGPGQILLEASDRSISSVTVGQPVTVEVAGKTQQFVVSGLSRTSGLPSATVTQVATGYMQATDLNALLGITGANTFLIQVHNYAQRQQTASELGQVLEAADVRVLGVAVGRASDSGSQTIYGLLSVMNVLSIISVLLSIFLLLSTITTLIAEQLPIIGTMKSIGAVRGQIIRSYLTTVAIYGVCGTVIGLALGTAIGYLLFSFFASIFNLDSGPLSISAELLIIALLVGVGVPLLVALLPIYSGTRITVRRALYGYGLASGGSSDSIVQRITSTLSFVPQTIQLGIRSLFRKRTRAMLTLAALAISGTAFLAVQTTAYSFGNTLSGVFDTYHADVLADVVQPVSYSKLQATLASVPGIAATEPLSQESVTAGFGQVLLTGVSLDPQLYHRHLLSGRWFGPGDTNAVIISQDAADKSKLKIGDTVTFHDSLHSVTWTIIGTARDYNGITLSGVMLAPLSEVNSFLHLPPDFANVLLIGSTSGKQSDINQLSARVDDALSSAGYQDRVLTIQQIKQSNESVFTIIYVLLYLVAVVIAVVGAIGLFNALAMSVLERRREIGILRSMGASAGKVAQVFWTEGLSLGTLAWTVALILGIPAAYLFVQLLGSLFLPVPFAFNPVSLLLMLLFILVVASLASLGPVVVASQVRIAETLRYE
jgi:putative ABC transport system permease protein